MTETRERCPSCCGTGSWETECCNGSGGCSCRGEVLDMGRCNVCGGTGSVSGVRGRDWDPDANLKTIRGLHFIGTGPSGMHETWPNRGGWKP